MNYFCVMIGIVVMLYSSCANARQLPIALSAAPTHAALAAELKDIADQAEYGESRSVRVHAATTGRERAAQCLATNRQDPACLYYHAVLTGLYYELTIFGYQNGLKEMVSDATRLIALDAAYADAGAYRILGQLYTQVPQTSFRPGGVTRDLPKARGYLEKAIIVAPHHFENHLALCETLVALEDWPAAQPRCDHAEQLLAAQHTHPGYAEWRKAMTAAKKRLAKNTNDH